MQKDPASSGAGSFLCYSASSSFCRRASDARMGSFCGHTASHLPQRTQCRAFSLSGKQGPLGFDGLLLLEHAQLVPDAEIVRDVHPHGAGHAVPASGAADLDAAVQHGSRLFHSCILSRGERVKVVKGGQIVGQLLLGTHAGEDHMHVVVSAHPAQRPGSIAGIRVQGMQRCGGVCGQSCQRAALDGLHDDNGTPHSSVSW